VVYGLHSSFEEAMLVNDIAREAKLPFYCLNASGLSAFFFVDLATDSFEFQSTKKDADGNEVREMNSNKGSVTLRKYAETLLSKEHTLNWKKREIMKASKLIMLAITALLLNEKSNAETQIFDFIKTKPGLTQHQALYTKQAPQVESHLKQFQNCFKNQVEFNPSSGVIGSITSQEIIKVITKKDFPEHGFFVFDSDSQ